MNRAGRRAARVAALVRAAGVPCRKVPHRASVRALWTRPSIFALRHYPNQHVKHIAALITAAAYAAMREELDDTARTHRLRGMDGWKEMAESGRWLAELRG
jgi:hypothetical protein